MVTSEQGEAVFTARVPWELTSHLGSLHFLHQLLSDRGWVVSGSCRGPGSSSRARVWAWGVAWQCGRYPGAREAAVRGLGPAGGRWFRLRSPQQLFLTPISRLAAF